MRCCRCWWIEGRSWYPF